MNTRKLANFEVSSVGIGCMGFSHGYGALPPEEVAEVMGELIKEGKICGWGQSQSTPEQIRRAHAITPLSMVQSEYSMMERMFEADVSLSPDELAEVEEALSHIVIHGNRTDEDIQRMGYVKPQ